MFVNIKQNYIQLCQKGPLNKFYVYTKNNRMTSNNLQYEMDSHAEANSQTK